MISPQKRSTSSKTSSCSTARLIRNSGPGEAPSLCSTFSLASKYRETVVGGTVTMTGWLSVDILFISRGRGIAWITTCPLVVKVEARKRFDFVQLRVDRFQV